MILRRGLPITLMILRHGPPFYRSLRSGLPYYKLMVLRRGPTIFQHKLMSLTIERGVLQLMILRRGFPFTVYVDEFKAWAPLLQYKLMILRPGLPFTL